jgi:predicted nucleic acid-binding Zn ribbon protein
MGGELIFALVAFLLLIGVWVVLPIRAPRQ